jgi:hypothetical protein
MRLFRRIGDIISANLNEMIDHFEDPEKMLKQPADTVHLADSTDCSNRWNWRRQRPTRFVN